MNPIRIEGRGAVVIPRGGMGNWRSAIETFGKHPESSADSRDGISVGPAAVRHAFPAEIRESAQIPAASAETPRWSSPNRPADFIRIRRSGRIGIVPSPSGNPPPRGIADRTVSFRESGFRFGKRACPIRRLPSSRAGEPGSGPFRDAPVRPAEFIRIRRSGRIGIVLSPFGNPPPRGIADRTVSFRESGFRFGKRACPIRRLPSSRAGEP